MPAIARFLLRRLLIIPVTLFIITALMYALVMLAPPETRATLYLPKGKGNNPNLTSEAEMIQTIIVRYGLNDPYPVQYARWAWRVLQGDWGWSPTLNSEVLPALLARTAPTAELTLYSVLLLVPMGVIMGGLAGWRHDRPDDLLFRLSAFAATAIPPFVMGLVLLAIFYAGLNWFPLGRISLHHRFVMESVGFRQYTGLITLDGLLNGRLDITREALRHLALPCITLSLAHWATLGRITRAAMIEELDKEYIIAARGRGLRNSALLWRHALSNTLAPAFNSIALSTASLITGVFVIEVIFDFPGISELIRAGMGMVPDVATTLGFAIYSVLLVLPVMLALDLLQAVVDPRIRDELVEAE